MHRINLRGPWGLSLSEIDEHVALLTLSRSFNAPTNLHPVSSLVTLALSLAQEPIQVLLNEQSLIAIPEFEDRSGETKPADRIRSDTVCILRYDVKSTLLSHNKLAIHWHSMASCDLTTDTRTVRLMTADTNTWLRDAWLEILES